jgi:hypothetical protein
VAKDDDAWMGDHAEDFKKILKGLSPKVAEEVKRRAKNQDYDTSKDKDKKKK